MKGTCTKLVFLFILFLSWFPAQLSWAQAISTVAGNGTNGGAGDGAPAANASVRALGVAMDASGNIYIADTDHHKIRKVDPVTKIITTVAGNGTGGWSGDGGAATAATLKTPYDIAVAPNGDLYIADYGNNRIRKVSGGIISTVAGNGFPGSSGDGSHASSAKIYGPASLALDASGNLYLTEYNGNRIRKVNASNGTISTLAGTGAVTTSASNLGDGGPATSATMKNPWGIAIDAGGNIFFADHNNSRIRKVNASDGKISTVAGTGIQGFSGDGGAATAAQIGTPAGIAVTSSGNIYFSERNSHRIRKVNASDGKISTVAGTGEADFSGDGGPAYLAKFNAPSAVEVDVDANIIVADYNNARIRHIEGFVNNGLTLSEGAMGALSKAALEFTDTNQPASAITYTLTVAVASGTLFRDANHNGIADAGETLVPSSTFTQANIDAGIIKYHHNGSETTTDGFGFTISDNAGKTLTDKTFIFTITKVNDAPVITDSGAPAWTTLEDTALPLTGLQMSDAEAGSDVVILDLVATNGIIKVRDDVADGVEDYQIFSNNSKFVTLMASLPAINATLAANGVVYFPDLHVNGTDNLVFHLNDNGSLTTGSGGPQTTVLSKIMNITPVNDTPVITSDGGGATAALRVNEKTKAVTTVTSTDVANENSTITYSLAGGEDQAQFSIDSNSGALTFLTAPDFRQPADADASNTYVVTVRATDNGSPSPNKFAEQTITVTVLDITPPVVSSNVRQTPAVAITNATSLAYQITFDEAVSGVDVADFTLASTGTASGTLASVSAASGTTMKVTVNGVSGDGTLRLDVKSSGTGIVDAANNGLAGGFTIGEIYTSDQTLPTVVITAPAANPVNAAFTATFTFSEDVTDFALEDISVSPASATASNFIQVNPKVYTATITPTVDGNVTVHVAADKAIDAATNGNAVSNTITRLYDATKPAVAITAPAADPVNAAFTATFTFSEPVSGFAQGDITVGNGAASGFTALSSTVYTAIITPAADGQVTVAVAADVAHDPATNGNTAAAALTKLYDATKPAVAITAPAADPVNAAFTATFTFSEPVSGFALGDITVGNGAASGFTAVSSTVYTAIITPAADGQVTVAVAADMAQDPAGNSNLAAASLTRTYDATQPTVLVATSAADPTNVNPMLVSITFSEDVADFVLTDIAVSNGVTSDFTAENARTYRVLVSPSADGPVSVQVAPGLAVDAAGNANAISNTLTRMYDAARPEVAVASTAPASVNSSFAVSFTFTEAVADFTLADISVTNATLSGFAALSAKAYTVTLTPLVAGPVSVSVASDQAHDAAANGNLASNVLTRAYDNIQASVLVSSPAANTVNAPYLVQVAFSEDVTGFEQADIAVTNGQASGFTQVNAREYTALITPAGEGLVKVKIASAIAVDEAGNVNLASNELTKTFDITKPTAVIAATAANPTNVTPIPVSITFSEAVTGFVLEDVVVTGGTAGDFAGSGKDYTFNLTPAGDGTITVNIAADVAQDVAANGNQAATPLARTYDATRPTVAITGPPAELIKTAFTATFTFSEPVSGFALSDITVSNGTAASFTATSATVYTVNITPSADGLVTVSVAANAFQDQAGNSNLAAASLARTYDATQPTVLVATAAADPTNVNPMPVSISFSEEVADFVLADITVTGGTAGNFAGSGKDYTLQVTPAGDGPVTVSVAANVAADAAANGNLASNIITRLYDATRPTVVVATAAADPTNMTPMPVSISFSEAVTGFALEDVVVTGGTAGNFAGSGKDYTVQVTPAGDGPVTVSVAANVAADAATNGNEASNSISRTYDATRPAVAITAPAANPVNAAFTATFTFSEPVSGFALADITVSNGTASGFSAVSTTVYTATITPVADGLVTVVVAADVAQDPAGNGNQAAADLTKTYDATKPAVAITAPAANLVNAAFTATFTFSEPVSGFALDDITVSNGAAANFTATSATVYTALITPAAEGEVKVSVAPAMAEDQAGNANLASNQLSKAYDAARPTVVLATTVADPTNVNLIPVSITFSEDVTGFVLADITVTGGTPGGLTGSGKNYTFTITPAGDGLVTVSVAANVAVDAAANGNLASNSISRTYDGTKPTLFITAPPIGLEAVRTPFTATFTFSESVSGFALADIVVNNGTIANFIAQSASVYTATITPEPVGTVTVDVAANVAQDGAANGNVAAASLLVEDVSCGNNRDKVLVCHEGQLICIARSSLKAHLIHGDKIGSCPNPYKGNSEFKVRELDLTVYPNPAKGNTNIEFTMREEGYFSLALYDLKGTLVKNIASGSAPSKKFFFFDLDVSIYPVGVYVVQLTTNQRIATKRLVIQK